MAHTEFGFKLLQKILTNLGDKVAIEREAKLEGRSLTAIIGRSKGGHINETKKIQVKN